MPFGGEERLGEHRGRGVGIRGDGLLQAAEAGLQVVGIELGEEREGTQAQPFEQVRWLRTAS